MIEVFCGGLLNDILIKYFLLLEVIGVEKSFFLVRICLESCVLCLVFFFIVVRKILVVVFEVFDFNGEDGCFL